LDVLGEGILSMKAPNDRVYETLYYKVREPPRIKEREKRIILLIKIK
jgi:hypothetical protein